MASSITVGILRTILTADTAEFDAALKRAGSGSKALSKELNSFGRQAQNVGTALTTALTLPIVGLGASSFKAFKDFESSFAGVRKTVDASEPEFAALAKGFRAMAKEIPINVNELNRIGEAAGQLGIKKDNILGFTDVIAKLGVTTNLSSDQAATSLARLANITQMPQSNFDKLGSTIVALGNNLATTEAEITEFGLRIAGAGKIAGLTEAQILAIGGAMSSVGVEAEAGGTAVQKVLLSMVQAVSAGGGKELEAFARTAGMTAQQFATAFRDNAGEAFAAFVAGLGQQGDQAFATLEELELGDQRLIRSFLSLAGAGDVLRGSLDLSTKAWAENSALTEEARKRFETTESQLTLLWQRVKDVGITIGNAMIPAVNALIGVLDLVLPAIETMAGWFGSLPEPVQVLGVAFAALAAAAGPVIYIAGQLAIAFAAIAPWFAAGTTGATLLAGAFTVLTGPIGLVTAAVVGLAAVWVTWGDDITRVVKETFSAIKTWLWDKLEPVLTPLIGLVESVGKMFEAFGKLVGAVTEKAYKATKNWIGDKLIGVFNVLVDTVKVVMGWIDKIPTPLLGLLGPIGLVVAAFRHWDEIKRIAEAVYTAIKTWLVDRFTSIVSAIKSKVDAVTGFFEDMYDKVVGNSYVPDMVNQIGQWFGRLDGMMVSPARDATRSVTSMFAQMGDAVFRSIGDLLSNTAQGATNLARQLVSIGLDTIVPGLGRLVDMAWPLIQKGLSKIWDGLKAFARKVKSVFNFFGSAPEDSFDPEKPSGGGPDPFNPNNPRIDPDTGEEIPEFDEGQNVPNFHTGTHGQFPDFGDGTLAMLHGRERITPWSERDELSMSGGGNMGTVILNLDGRQIARGVFPFIPDEAQRYQVGVR